MGRPEFDNIKDYDEFSKYYWYRDELIKICKSHGLISPSGKAELNKAIKAYFDGVKIKLEKRNVKSKKTLVNELTLDTGLLECGFTFGKQFREFFQKQTGEEHFKFTCDMAATVKRVKENGDTSFTLGDLLDVYYGKKTYAVYDRSICQWNQFLKDFCADNKLGEYTDKLKSAAALWKIVRDSDMAKVYTKELYEKYRDKI